MFRVVPFVAVAGCLWIPAGEHDERLARDAFVVYELVLEPAGASACGGPDAELAARLSVGEGEAGRTFELAYALNGGPAVEVGARIATNDGWLSFPLVLEDWASRTGCASGCTLPIRFTVSRAGLEVVTELPLQLLPPLVPELREVSLADATGVRVPLDEAERNPDGAWDVVTWPEIHVGFRDRHFGLGLGGRASLWYCPGTTSPETEPGACVFAPMSATPVVVEGEQGFVGPTEALGARVCQSAVPAPDWQLFVRVEGHACGGPYTFPLSAEPVTFVLDDCDHDGFPSGVDCNDLDAAQSPDGVEICDAVDNNCDGETLTQAATVLRPTGPPENFLDLQLALDSASAGDRVVVCPGTYPGRFTVDRELTITGPSSDPADVVLEGTESGSVLSVTGVALPALTLRGLTLTGGTGASRGGGLDARDAGSLLVEDCVIHDNEALRGGGLAASPVTTLRRTTIRNNSATEGGGVALGSRAAIWLEASVVEANSATEGAGIHVSSVEEPELGISFLSVLTLDAASRIDANLATRKGGGIYAVGDFSMSGGSLTGNDGPAGGGAIMLEGVLDESFPAPSHWTLADTVISGNSSYYGGGLAVYGTGLSTFEATRLVVSANTADTGGGFLLGAARVPELTSTLVDVTVESNDARIGGGISVEYATLLTTGGHLKWNTADEGAGLAIAEAVVTTGEGSATDIEFNEARASGGGIRIERNATLDVRSGRVSGNTAINGGGIAVDGASVLFGGALVSNVAAVGAGFLLGDVADVRVSSGAELSGNLESEVREDAALEVCTGVVVSDALGQGGDPDCFRITADGYTDGCGC